MVSRLPLCGCHLARPLPPPGPTPARRKTAGPLRPKPGLSHPTQSTRGTARSPGTSRARLRKREHGPSWRGHRLGSAVSGFLSVFVSPRLGKGEMAERRARARSLASECCGCDLPVFDPAASYSALGPLTELAREWGRDSPTTVVVWEWSATILRQRGWGRGERRGGGEEREKGGVSRPEVGPGAELFSMREKSCWGPYGSMGGPPGVSATRGRARQEAPQEVARQARNRPQVARASPHPPAGSPSPSH